MERAFNDKVALQALTELESHQQLAVGAACCERMLPNYSRFTTEVNWGDLPSVRSALDVVWDACSREVLGGTDMDRLLASCEAAIPHADEFRSLYVSSAQEAVFAVCALLDFMGDRDPERIVSVLRFAIDSVDLIVQEQEGMDSRDPLLERKILGHPLMQQELVRQRRDMSEAARFHVGQQASLFALRNRVASECNLVLVES